MANTRNSEITERKSFRLKKMLLSYRQVHNNYLIRYNYLFSFKTVSISETGDNAFAVYPNLLRRRVMFTSMVRSSTYTSSLQMRARMSSRKIHVLYSVPAEARSQILFWSMALLHRRYLLFLCDVNNERLISKTFGDSFRFRCYCAS